MSDDTKPSNWQQAIDGEWHGCPSLFEHDGTHVGTNKVSRASEFKDGRTTYWMETRFDATGPLMDRLEIGSRMEFGVVDSDKNRIYTGPDFIGSGRPFGLLVDSRYYYLAFDQEIGSEGELRIRGFGSVAMVRDLMMLMPQPGPTAGEALHATWLQRFSDLDQLDGQHRHTSAATQAEGELSEAIKRSRTAVLDVLHGLD